MFTKFSLHKIAREEVTNIRPSYYVEKGVELPKLYFANYDIGKCKYVKIGITSVSVIERLYSILTPEEWTCIYYLEHPDPLIIGNLEKKTHRHFSKFNSNGEWFRFPDCQLEFPIEIVEYIKTIIRPKQWLRRPQAK